jgi:hypothetical protein
MFWVVLSIDKVVIFKMKCSETRCKPCSITAYPARNTALPTKIAKNLPNFHTPKPCKNRKTLRSLHSSHE